MKLIVLQAPKTRGKPEDQVDALFRLPLAEFIGARKTLAAQLKKSGRGDEAGLVKALVKPSVSAWAVNQLYWNHREAFDRLIASGEHFHKAQTSRLGGKLADMRTAIDARREVLSQLSDLATSLLQDAGHSQSLDIIRRITTTLEGMSAYASRSDGPRPGRLTHDVDPPGFEALASFIPGAGMTELKEKPARFTPSEKSRSAATKTRRKVAPDTDLRQVEAARKATLAGIAAAKVSLQEARRALIKARDRAHSLQAAQKKAEAEAKETEKQIRQAAERLEKARARSEGAAQRVRSVALEVEEAAESVEDAERTVEEASEEFEKLSRESPRR